MMHAVEKKTEECSCVEQSHELFSKIRGRGRASNVFQTNVCMLAFVQSYSQSQARLMFATTLGMDNFDCTKMNAHFKKFTACLREGVIHEWKQALVVRTLPAVSV